MAVQNEYVDPHEQNTDIGTNQDDFSIGDGTDTTKSIIANNADENKPKLRYNHSTNKWQYSNNGVDFVDIGSGGSGGDMYKSTYDTDDDNIVDKSESVDDGNGNSVSASEMIKNIYNTVLLAFKLAVQGSLTIFNMVDGIVDEYEDESGIDTVNSVNEEYDSIDDYYNPCSTISADTKLLLHCNGVDESTTFTDASPSEHGNATVFGSSQVDTAEKKFGTGSLLLDGAGDYLTYPDHTDWDIVASNSDNRTIDLWVKHDTLGANDIYLAQIDAGANNYWQFWHRTTQGLTFQVYSGGDLILLSGGEITDTNWHHVALIKVADEYGLYLDGTQVAYVQDNSTFTSSDNLKIGSNGFSYFDGHMDEIRIQHSNPFNASPNSGKTDSIIVPTEEYGNLENMTLISETFSAESEPSSARIVVFEEDVDVITLNTDLKAYISKDDGDTWAETTLVDEGDYDATKRILVGNVDLSQSGIGSGTDMRYKLVTDNEKNLKIHGTGLLWDN